MARDVHRRLIALEAQRDVSATKFELWATDRDALVRYSAGDVMTQEAFDAAFANAHGLCAANRHIIKRSLGR